jgi:NADPH-dependent 2,4-dienoyl-CoA reductase/sulfur reductase-like enzyme
MSDYDAVVVGGGPAGLGAARMAKERGLKVLILENTERIGGILLQCIHPGFGLHYLKEDLTGPEFSCRLVKKVKDLNIECYTNAHVLEILPISDLEKLIKVITPKGIFEIVTTSIIYAAGARERHLYEIGITGDRVSGIYTAGEAQAMMDIYGIMPGKEVVIVGSGDVGLIMARRFALEGAKVKAVIEIMPYPGGLVRNVVQCLQDFEIPLYLSHAVMEVRGKRRVEKIITSKTREDLQPIPGTEEEMKCDTMVVAAGLVPYIKMLKDIGVIVDPATNGPMVNEYLETSVPGIFVAGNAMTINDLVDYAVEQGEMAAEGAQIFVKNEGIPTKRWKPIVKGRNMRSVIPHYISGERNIVLYARVKNPENEVKVLFPEIRKEIKLPAVKPAGMLRIELRKKDLAKVEDRLTMEVVTDEQEG